MAFTAHVFTKFQNSGKLGPTMTTDAFRVILLNGTYATLSAGLLAIQDSAATMADVKAASGYARAPRLRAKRSKTSTVPRGRPPAPPAGHRSSCDPSATNRRPVVAADPVPDAVLTGSAVRRTSVSRRRADVQMLVKLSVDHATVGTTRTETSHARRGNRKDAVTSRMSEALDSDDHGAGRLAPCAMTN